MLLGDVDTLEPGLLELGEANPLDRCVRKVTVPDVGNRKGGREAEGLSPVAAVACWLTEPGVHEGWGERASAGSMNRLRLSATVRSMRTNAA
jgi:hypothetical protein